jgi:hypothetical protein
LAAVDATALVLVFRFVGFDELMLQILDAEKKGTPSMVCLVIGNRGCQSN